MQLGDFTRMGLLALRSLCLNLIPCTSSIRHRKKYLNQTTSRSDGQIEIYLKKRKKDMLPYQKERARAQVLGALFLRRAACRRVAEGPRYKSWKAPFNARVLSSSVLKPMFS